MTVEITLGQFIWLLFLGVVGCWLYGRIRQGRAISRVERGTSSIDAPVENHAPRFVVAEIEEDEETEPFPMQVHIYGDVPHGLSADAAVALAVREWRLAGSPRVHASSHGLQVHSMIRGAV